LAGVNVITPKSLTEYVPTFVTVIVDPGATVQFGAVCDKLGSHKRIVEGTRAEVVAAALRAVVSLVRRFFVCAVFNGPLEVSGNAVGFGEL
jgi:hypothetical protein